MIIFNIRLSLLPVCSGSGVVCGPRFPSRYRVDGPGEGKGGSSCLCWSQTQGLHRQRGILYYHWWENGKGTQCTPCYSGRVRLVFNVMLEKLFWMISESEWILFYSPPYYEMFLESLHEINTTYKHWWDEQQ